MELSKIIESIDNLPPAPKILTKLQALLQDEDIILLDLIGLIKVDASLTSKILHLSNSSYFSNPTRCNSLEEAINRIGFSEIFKLVSIINLKSMLIQDAGIYKLKREQVWEQSISCAIFLESFASTLQLDTNYAYTLGLLHSIGKVIISTYLFNHRLSNTNYQTITPSEAHQVLGFDYGQAGAALCKKWEFSESITEPIEYHLQPEKSTKYQQITYLLALSAQLSQKTDSTHRIDQYPIQQPTLLSPEMLNQSIRIAQKRLLDAKKLISTF